MVTMAPRKQTRIIWACFCSGPKHIKCVKCRTNGQEDRRNFNRPQVWKCFTVLATCKCSCPYCLVSIFITIELFLPITELHPLYGRTKKLQKHQRKKWPYNIQNMFFIIHAGEKTHIQSSRVPKCLFIYLFVSAKLKKKVSLSSCNKQYIYD